MHEDLDACLRLAALTMALGETDRATRHPDGRPETDTTHTVMLQLVALHLLPYEERDVPLSTRMVLLFALVHDLPEAYAGDTSTARGLDPDAAAQKAAREALAIEQIGDLLGASHGIVSLIRRYEAQEEPEARWVRLIDKVLPKLTHALGMGRALQCLGMTRHEMAAAHRVQLSDLRELYPEFPRTLALLEAAGRSAEQAALLNPKLGTRPKGGEKCG